MQGKDRKQHSSRTAVINNPLHRGIRTCWNRFELNDIFEFPNVRAIESPQQHMTFISTIKDDFYLKNKYHGLDKLHV